jgi:hypothetical protein
VLLASPDACHDRYVEAIQACVNAGLRLFADGLAVLRHREEQNLDPQPTRDWIRAELRRLEEPR